MGFEAWQGLSLTELCLWHHLNQHGSATSGPAYSYTIPFLLLAPGQVD